MKVNDVQDFFTESIARKFNLRIKVYPKKVYF